VSSRETSDAPGADDSPLKEKKYSKPAVSAIKLSDGQWYKLAPLDLGAMVAIEEACGTWDALATSLTGEKTPPILADETGEMVKPGQFIKKPGYRAILIALSVLILRANEHYTPTPDYQAALLTEAQVANLVHFRDTERVRAHIYGLLADELETEQSDEPGAKKKSLG
jgi:hypothetical protein